MWDVFRNCARADEKCRQKLFDIKDPIGIYVYKKSLPNSIMAGIRGGIQNWGPLLPSLYRWDSWWKKEHKYRANCFIPLSDALYRDANKKRHGAPHYALDPTMEKFAWLSSGRKAGSVRYTSVRVSVWYARSHVWWYKFHIMYKC